MYPLRILPTTPPEDISVKKLITKAMYDIRFA